VVVRGRSVRCFDSLQALDKFRFFDIIALANNVLIVVRSHKTKRRECPVRGCQMCTL
jgi:hypothetical protein